MIAQLALVAAFATVAQATPAAGPPASKEMQALKDSVAGYFHKANDAFGGPRPYFFYSISKDESGLAVTVHRTAWDEGPQSKRTASVNDAQQWWKKTCKSSSHRCLLTIYDDKGKAILGPPKH